MLAPAALGAMLTVAVRAPKKVNDGIRMALARDGDTRTGVGPVRPSFLQLAATSHYDFEPATVFAVLWVH